MKIVLDDNEIEFIERQLERKGGAIRMLADTFIEEYYLPIISDSFTDDVCDIIRENNLGD